MDSIMNSTVGTHATVAALALSLIALICSTAALLCQHVATADGYRRCQPSVLGPWATLTRSRWNWSRFGFERLFVVPEFVITSPTGNTGNECIPSTQAKALRPVGIEPITGSAESRERTLTPGRATSVDSSEVASWVCMLESIQRHESWLNKLGSYRGASRR